MLGIPFTAHTSFMENYEHVIDCIRTNCFHTVPFLCFLLLFDSQKSKFVFKLFVCHVQISRVPHYFGAHWNWGTIFGSTFFNSYLFTCKSYGKTKKLN